MLRRHTRLGLAVAVLQLTSCADDPLTSGDDVGDSPWCEPVATWPVYASELESVLVRDVNHARKQGATCGTMSLAPALTIEESPELRCAARRHAIDLAAHGLTGTEGSDGSNQLQRLALAGYDGLARAELRAYDFLNEEDVVTAWLASPEHCMALLDERLDDVGAGYARSSDEQNIVWVVLTGEHRDF